MLRHIPSVYLAYDLARWGTAELSSSTRQERREFFSYVPIDRSRWRAINSTSEINPCTDATALTDRFDRALLYATHVHGGQVRKQTSIPYVAHLLAVAATVIEYGGSEDMAIAASCTTRRKTKGERRALAICATALAIAWRISCDHAPIASSIPQPANKKRIGAHARPDISTT